MRMSLAEVPLVQTPIPFLAVNQRRSHHHVAGSLHQGYGGPQAGGLPARALLLDRLAMHLYYMLLIR